MPELPEVETVVRDLCPMLIGRRIAQVRVGKKSLRQPWQARWAARIAGRRFEALNRRGKWIVADLGGPLLVIHLGMTGQLTVRPRDHEFETHTHLIFSLDDGKQQLRFRDIRRFGSARVFADRAQWDANIEVIALGPEPFDVDRQYWQDALSKTRRNLKAILLDQRVLAGVGNIYADESLFAAQLDPRTIGRAVKPPQAQRLRKSIATVLARAIEARGSTIRDYVGGSGLRGGYQEKFFVYGRTGEPCRRCKTPIERTVLAGRSTHYCPKCQERL